MVIHSNDLETEQHGFRVSIVGGQGVSESDVFEVEAAARDCALYLRARGHAVECCVLMRETYAGEIISEWSEPITWLALETAGG